MAYTLDQAIHYARTQLLRDYSSSLSDPDAIAFANDFNTSMRRELVARRKSLFVREGTLPVTANEIVGGSSAGVFFLPDDVLLIRHLEVDLSGLGDFVTATPYDQSNVADSYSLAWLRENQPVTEPLVDFRGDRFEILPTPAVIGTGLVRYQGHEFPAPFTAVTDNVDYPFNQDISILAYGIAYLFMRPLNTEKSDKLKEEAYARVNSIIKMIGAGSQMPVQAKSVNVGNSGWLN